MLVFRFDTQKIPQLCRGFFLYLTPMKKKKEFTWVTGPATYRDEAGNEYDSFEELIKANPIPSGPDNAVRMTIAEALPHLPADTLKWYEVIRP